MKSLAEVLAYRAPELLLRFESESGFERIKTESLFLELKRWLWACAKRIEDETLGKQNVPDQLLITPETRAIDMFWHCFLLFTREYQDFCSQYLGVFVHHVPLTRRQIEAFQRLRETEPKQAQAQRQAELKPQLEYLYDILGADTVRFWYREMNDVYKFSEITARTNASLLNTV